MDELPAENEVKADGQVVYSAEGSVNIDSPFLDLAIGAELETFYFEYRALGTDLTDKHQTLRFWKIGRRIYF